ncbi:MAG: hypothetical protein IPL65_09235 [Lewinellaceae bacterium]|nr:hypothetical protein [Lewinellaceae bacterium]
MPLNVPIDELKGRLRDQLIDNPADALKSMLELLPKGSEKADSASTLLGEINDTNKQRLRGTLSNEELQRAYNRIRAAVFDLIDGLVESDFDPTASDPKTAKAKQGEILYRIPDTMPLQQETRCLVRIALDQDAIVEDIMLDEHVTLKPLHRISDLMQVELIDPSSDGVFKLRSINSPEQLVEDEGYTEWLFYVTPLREGTYPLLIKVAVIELLHGQERKKEIVLEEEVRILSKAPAATAEVPLKTVGEKLLFQTPDPNITYAKPPEMPEWGTIPEKESAAPFPASEIYIPAAAPPAPQPAARTNGSPWKRLAAVFAGILLLGTTATWAIAPQEVAWVWTRYVQDSPSALASYAVEFPESRHREVAVYRRATLLKTVDAYRDYTAAFPTGRFRTNATQALEIIELSDFERLKTRPTTTNVSEFVEKFPESHRLNNVKNIVEQSQNLRPELSPEVLKKLDIPPKQLIEPIRKDSSAYLNTKPGLEIKTIDRNQNLEYNQQREKTTPINNSNLRIRRDSGTFQRIRKQ